MLQPRKHTLMPFGGSKQMAVMLLKDWESPPKENGVEMLM
jgi:hypothetical protein